MKMFAIKLLPAIVVAALAVSLSAQFPTPDGARTENEYELEARIARMRYLISLAEKRGVRRKVDPKLALEELQEDFTRIQILNKDLVLTTAKTENPDLKFVGKSASEINKRAARLMSNLALPEPSADGPNPTPEDISDSPQLKKSITALGWLIYGFTKNPMFKEANVVEATAAEKAGRDLAEIIERSLQLKKASEKLGKAARKSH